MSTVAAMRGVPYSLQAAGSTTGNGDVVAPPASFRYHTITIIGSAGVGAGAVQIEASNDAAYAGTWAQVGGGPVTVVASASVIINFIGVFQFLRARYSTNVTGGTSEVKYEGAL